MSSRRLFYLIPLCLLFVVMPLTAAEDKEKDARLDQKVTLSLGSVTMDQFAAELSKLTGIQITAGSSRNDWQVKERRTIVYVKDVSAGELMQRVAALHHYRLSKSGPEGKWAYNYRQDKRRRDEESKLRDDQADSLYNKTLHSMDYMAELSGLDVSPSDLNQLAEKQPYMHFLLKDPLGRAMCDVAARLPLDFISKDGRQTMSLDKADPALREAATRFIREMISLERKWNGETEESPDYSALFAKDVRFHRYNSAVQSSEDRAAGVLGELDISYGERDTVDFPVLDPEGVIAKVISKAAEGTRKGENLQHLEQEVNEMIKQKTDDYPLKGDPLLEEKIKLEKESDYPLLLKHVHEKTKLSVISDSYRERFVLGGEILIKHIVDLARDASNKEMEKQGRWFVARDNLWFYKRQVDIPEAYLRDLRDKLKERDLVYQDFVRIVCDLTDSQIEDNLVSQPGLEQLNSLYPKLTREGLRFLSALTPGQLKAMTGESSLSAKDLPEDVLQHGLAAIGWTQETVQGKEIYFTKYKLEMDKSKKQQIGAYFTINVTEEDGSISPSGWGALTHAVRIQPAADGNEQQTADSAGGN